MSAPEQSAPEQTPVERLRFLVDKVSDHLPAMVKIMLDNYCQVWLSQMTDEAVLNLCSEIKKAAEYVETGSIAQ